MPRLQTGWGCAEAKGLTTLRHRAAAQQDMLCQKAGRCHGAAPTAHTAFDRDRVPARAFMTILEGSMTVQLLCRHMPMQLTKNGSSALDGAKLAKPPHHITGARPSVSEGCSANRVLLTCCAPCGWLPQAPAEPAAAQPACVAAAQLAPAPRLPAQGKRVTLAVWFPGPVVCSHFKAACR